MVQSFRKLKSKAKFYVVCILPLYKKIKQIWSGEGQMNYKVAWKNLRVKDMFIILILMISQEYSYVNTH